MATAAPRRIFISAPFSNWIEVGWKVEGLASGRNRPELSHSRACGGSREFFANISSCSGTALNRPALLSLNLALSGSLFKPCANPIGDSPVPDQDTAFPARTGARDHPAAPRAAIRGSRGEPPHPERRLGTTPGPAAPGPREPEGHPVVKVPRNEAGRCLPKGSRLTGDWLGPQGARHSVPSPGFDGRHGGAEPRERDVDVASHRHEMDCSPAVVPLVRCVHEHRHERVKRLELPVQPIDEVVEAVKGGDPRMPRTAQPETSRKSLLPDSRAALNALSAICLRSGPRK